MKIHKQLFRHDPGSGVYGDCHRTAIAAMLDLEVEEVPHFGTHFDNAVAFHKAVQAFLNGRGYTAVTVIFNCNLQSVLDHQGAMNPGVYYLLGGESRTGVGHTVVCCGNEIVCDPSLDDSGIIGPMEDGYYWITYLTPLCFVRCADPCKVQP